MPISILEVIPSHWKVHLVFVTGCATGILVTLVVQHCLDTIKSMRQLAGRLRQKPTHSSETVMLKLTMAQKDAGIAHNIAALLVAAGFKIKGSVSHFFFFYGSLKKCEEMFGTNYNKNISLPNNIIAISKGKDISITEMIRTET